MRLLRLFVCVLPLLTMAACDEKLSDLTGPTPNLTPSFASIQKEIFATTDSSGCLACTSCHVAGGAANGTGLFLNDPATAYASLVGRPARLSPGDLAGYERFMALSAELCSGPALPVDLTAFRAARLDKSRA